MGCVYSTPQRPLFRRSEEANGNGSTVNNSKIFDVVNVDDRGNEINHGQIEITENDLILHQRNKNSIVWPLRSLRRYGFDAELFSFECGRRCSTGPGIYAFKCVHAEQLFNVLQESLQHCTNITTPNNHITSPQHGTNQESVNLGTTVASPVIPTSTGSNCSAPPELAARAPVPVPPPPLLPNSPPHSYVNDIRSYINSPFYANTGVMNGTIAGLPFPSSHVNISKGRTGSARSASDINTNYAKLDDLVDYVNIDTAAAQYQTGVLDSTVTTTAPTVIATTTCTNTSSNSETNESLSTKRKASLACEEFIITNDEEQNCSTNAKDAKPPNLPVKPLPTMVPSCSSSTAIQGSSSQSSQAGPTISPKLTRRSESALSESITLSEIAEPVNYIILDLENTNTNNNNGPVYVTTGPATPVFKTPEEGSFILPGTTPPSTPTSIKSISSNYPPQSYATIDFDKTMALSNSAASHRKI